jgi:spore coat polysaccharide biosynthesis protein SpsF (cytidylyltransferase family)/sialic acid synthase SpsE
MSYTIIELANTHGGDIYYLNDLIKDFEKFNDGYGMKFQPLHPDKLATKDFEWYPVYEVLYFKPEQWSNIIDLAIDTSKDVWIDIFDGYGIQILTENLSKVYGLKLQVSVLFNYGVLEQLSNIDLSGKKLIINVAALEVVEIKYFLERIEESLNVEEILIEVGFQGYPTELMDSGLSKIQTVKNIFNKRVVFADHIDSKDDKALILPVLALMQGADIIEKHVMLSDRETKYDFYSSVNSEQFSKMIDYIESLSGLLNAPFINQKEKDYLQKSLMKPILNINKVKGEGVSILTDFDFKRSNNHGLNSKEIEGLLSDFHILSTNKKEYESIQKDNFKKANIAVIVAGRLKSSRLKEKALLNIGNLSSIEFCLKNACKFDNVNNVVLATSHLESDKPLENHTYNDSVIFHQGDPEDVIQRYLDIVNKLEVDIIVRVTADMPFIDNEILQILLNSHFKSGADYTSARAVAIGANLEVINAQALRKVKDHFPSAHLSEYMTWYFTNNAEHFKLNYVDLPNEFVRDYRLTLDYQEDLDMFNKIHDALGKKPDYNLRDVIKFLDNNPDVAKINSHITLKYKTDQTLIDKLNKETKI